jgi:hypothetical protein
VFPLDISDKADGAGGHRRSGARRSPSAWKFAAQGGMGGRKARMDTGLTPHSQKAAPAAAVAKERSPGVPAPPALRRMAEERTINQNG